MYISEVIKRLEELRRVESDIHLLVQNERGLPVEEFTFDTFTDDTGMRRVMLFPTSNLVYRTEISTEDSVQEELELDLDPSVQNEAFVKAQEEERVFEDQPEQAQRTTRTRQSRERSKE